MLAIEKHSNLLQKLVNYERKKFYNIEVWGLYQKTFLLRN
jgi:hypothetical protein